MTENPEIPGEEARAGSSAPGLEGEGGQYVDSDYGDGGSEESAGTPEDAVREGLTDGQVMSTTEERGPLHGDRDAER
jgi:hypothetical protein